MPSTARHRESVSEVDVVDESDLADVWSNSDLAARIQNATCGRS
jgi:hypothetical protein